MRYEESREQSAEILRAAIAFMGQHPAAFHPPNYTLWYEHAAGINPGLTDVLEQQLRSGARLTDDEVMRLHAQYVLARDVTKVEHIEERLQLLLQEASHAVASAGEDATWFGHSLEEHTTRLENPMGLELIQKVVAELLDDTRHMSMVNQELVKQLERTASEVRDLSARLQTAQTEALADPLTGLNNRRGLERAVSDGSQSWGGLEGAMLLIIDIDHFKTINDRYGHVLGDKILHALGQVLRASLRGQDISARFGGDEFAVLLPETTLAGAMTVAEKIRRTVSKLRLRRAGHDDSVGNVTVSVGIASGRNAEPFEKLIERADAALYAAKRAGRDRVAVED